VNDLFIASPPPPRISPNTTVGSSEVNDRPDIAEVRQFIHSAAMQLIKGEISKDAFMQTVKEELTRYLGRPASDEDVFAELESMRDSIVNALGPGAKDNAIQRALDQLRLW
jgi:hypothetical protein